MGQRKHKQGKESVRGRLQAEMGQKKMAEMRGASHINTLSLKISSADEIAGG